MHRGVAVPRAIRDAADVARTAPAPASTSPPTVFVAPLPAANADPSREARRTVNARRWSLVAGVAALAAAAAVWALTGGRAPDLQRPAAGGGTDGAARDPGPASAPASGAAVQPPAADAAPRTSVEVPVRTATPTAPAAQGLRGVVVDEARRPLSGLSVYLVDSVGNEPLATTVLRQQRDAFGPVASTETAADGAFALGLPVAQERQYEVYVVSPVHATARLGGLQIVAGEWHDLGTITMSAGGSLRGRVSVAGRDDIPVPGAVVSVEIGATFADFALRALPDAGQGLTATTDANGRYELRHVPSRGVVQARCIAAGFARALRPDVELRADRPVDVDFALLPGHSIAGSVHDERGAPLAGARVEAWPKQAASPPSIVATDAQGRFDVLGLLAGPHLVRVTARGCEQQERPDVDAGRADLQFVLAPASRVRVQVVAPDGRTLRSYQLALRRWFEQQDQIGRVMEVAEQRVRLDGATDHALIENVPRGVFRCEVEAEGFAKTLSEPIRNVVEPGAPGGPREFTVVVAMTTGATLRGQVLTEDGAPLASASVLTQTAGTRPDSPFTRLVAGIVPDRVTVTRTTTAADGTFALNALALGDYQLLVEHPDACRTIVRDLRLDQSGERRLPPIRLASGAIVRGRATVAGRVAPQVKVVLTTPAALPAGVEPLRLEAVTDPTGAYELPRRVPPGSYELRAATVGTTEPEAQGLRQLLQLRGSSFPVVVLAGQRQVDRDIDLPEH
jgi:hypothetical protein